MLFGASDIMYALTPTLDATTIILKVGSTLGL